MLELKIQPEAEAQCLFEAETLALQSLIAGANPNPQDDYSMNTPSADYRITKYSTELINQLIDCIKAI